MPPQSYASRRRAEEGGKGGERSTRRIGGPLPLARRYTAQHDLQQAQSTIPHRPHVNLPICLWTSSPASLSHCARSLSRQTSEPLSHVVTTFAASAISTGHSPASPSPSPLLTFRWQTLTMRPILRRRPAEYQPRTKTNPLPNLQSPIHNSRHLSPSPTLAWGTAHETPASYTWFLPATA